MAMLEQQSEAGPKGASGEVAEAARRLDGALTRLEELVERRAAREAALQSALGATKEENDELRALLERLATRVDVAVGRLEEVLEE